MEMRKKFEKSAQNKIKHAVNITLYKNLVLQFP